MSQSRPTTRSRVIRKTIPLAVIHFAMSRHSDKLARLRAFLVDPGEAVVVSSTERLTCSKQYQYSYVTGKY